MNGHTKISSVSNYTLCMVSPRSTGMFHFHTDFIQKQTCCCLKGHLSWFLFILETVSCLHCSLALAFFFFWGHEHLSDKSISNRYPLSIDAPQVEKVPTSKAFFIPITQDSIGRLQTLWAELQCWVWVEMPAAHHSALETVSDFVRI